MSCLGPGVEPVVLPSGRRVYEDEKQQLWVERPHNGVLRDLRVVPTPYHVDDRAPPSHKLAALAAAHLVVLMEPKQVRRQVMRR